MRHKILYRFQLACYLIAIIALIVATTFRVLTVIELRKISRLQKTFSERVDR
jgi:hypothetical protein